MNSSDNSLLKECIKEIMESDTNYKKIEKNYGGNLNRIEEIPVIKSKIIESKDSLIIKNKESYKYVISSLNYENKDELKDENLMKEYLDTSFIDDNKSVKSSKSRKTNFSKEVGNNKNKNIKEKKITNFNKSSIIESKPQNFVSGNKSFLDFLNNKFDGESRFLKYKINDNKNSFTPKKENEIQFLNEIISKESTWGTTNNRYFKKINTYSKMPDKKLKHVHNKNNKSVILPVIK